MNHLLTIIIFFAFCSCKENSNKKNDFSSLNSPKPTSPHPLWDTTNKLQEEIMTFEIQYTLWGCNCPNWIKTSDAKKYSNPGATIDQEYINNHFYLEPAHDSLYFPDSSFQFNKQTLLVTGQYYQNPGHPKGTFEEEEPSPKAPIFRYIKIDKLDNRNLLK